MTYKNHTVLLPLRDIEYFESNLRKIVVRISGEQYEAYRKLDDIENEKFPGFVRCHKSYIVNLNHVRVMVRSHFELISGRIVPIAQRRYPFVENAFSNYVNGHAKIMKV
ncbi:MAG: LytTR family transcriptional regulator [Clostridiales Family XIII bacterium]|nr:LytTR family transcriptional regulator [Clostridiales Family XIII bacterium]